MNKPLIPPATIGILGGGQLGKMIALSAKAMGYQVATLDPTPNCPCAQIADHHIVADYDCLTGAKKLAAISDVVTYEFENIDPSVADFLESKNLLPQGYSLLFTTQNRLREKLSIELAGGKVAPYRRVNNERDLRNGIEELGMPVILKTAEGGYDGKGQLLIAYPDQIESAIEMIKAKPRQWVVEKYIKFVKELSLVVAGNLQGNIACFPVVENIHYRNILHMTIAPARIDQVLMNRARQIGVNLAKSFNLVGLLAIELFLTLDGDLIVNELAPRPHNSGHFSQLGCHTSQFEQHVRAICNFPLTDVDIVTPTVMVNILGRHLQPVLEQVGTWGSDRKLHLYGKDEVQPDRKMGHINFVATDIRKTLREIDDLGIWDRENSKLIGGK